MVSAGEASVSQRSSEVLLILLPKELSLSTVTSRELSRIPVAEGGVHVSASKLSEAHAAPLRGVEGAHRLVVLGPVQDQAHAEQADHHGGPPAAPLLRPPFSLRPAWGAAFGC